jgi:hypothetical protein
MNSVYFSALIGEDRKATLNDMENKSDKFLLFDTY